jgi:hypothetical protein
MIITVAFVLLIPINAFGYTSDYEERDPRLKHPPTLCAIPPSAPLTSQVVQDMWMKEVENGVNEFLGCKF